MLTHTHYACDAAGNVVETVTADRQPTDSPNAAGPLGDASGNGGPAARVSYTDYYYDAANRPTAASDVGTNGGSAWARPGTVPGRSAADLVTSYGYDAAGNVATVTDPNGLVTAYTYDALGRTTKTVADYTDGTPTDSSNQTTTYAYDGDNHVIDMIAVLPAGQASQETHYEYGVVTAGGSGIDDNDLLRSVWYPDPTTGQASSFQAEYYRYDAVGDPTTYTDRNGTTHAYGYDALGRLTSDAVTAFGTGVDQTVQRLGYAYNDAGLLAATTSYGTAASGPPNVLNQTVETYDGFGQLASEAQAVSGSVNGSTPTVGYTYDTANGDRLTGIVYPNGRTISYDYAGTLDGAASRLSGISDGGGPIQSYGYQGLYTPLVTTDGNGVTETATLDGLGRVQSLTYANSSESTVDGFTYTYDADGSVLSRRNAVLPGQSELYTYDGLNRLTGFTRGTLNGAGTAVIGTPTGTVSWQLDAVGNWKSNTVDGVTTTRTNNAQNQVVTLTTPTTGGGNTTATLGYDKDGNTLTDEIGQQYVYDAWNRLVAVKNAADTTIAAYAYDAQGRRVTQTESGTTTTLYYDQNWNVIEERQGGQTTTQYVWNPNGVDQLVERDDQPNASGTLTRRLYVEQDADTKRQRGHSTLTLVDRSFIMLSHAQDDTGGRWRRGAKRPEPRQRPYAAIPQAGRLPGLRRPARSGVGPGAGRAAVRVVPNAQPLALGPVAGRGRRAVRVHAVAGQHARPPLAAALPLGRAGARLPEAVQELPGPLRLRSGHDRHYLTLLRYVEANARRAGLVDRAEDWPWGSLVTAATGTGRVLLSDGPLDRPRHWRRLVNEPLAEPSLVACRASVVRGRPFGSDEWVRATAQRLGLGFTLRVAGGRGRRWRRPERRSDETGETRGRRHHLHDRRAAARPAGGGREAPHGRVGQQFGPIPAGPAAR